ncbi:MAG TPA: P-loop NTPase [Bryobacteraceae bacterium]|nr:P-loop NTPase [Bryobacteraceae bacterium]
MKGRAPVLTALSIVPDRELASQFTQATEHSRAFQILSELKAYPSAQTLEIRLRQTKPDLVLLDLATDLDAACDLIRSITAISQQTHVVGLHVRNDSEAILRSLRMGASEFLYAPFDVNIHAEALARLHRLLQPGPTDDAQPGTVLSFSSAKPGSGASTLAAQTAFALRRTTNKRVLLADFDLMGGMIGFYLKLTNTKSLLDAVQGAEQLNEGLWPALVAACDGVDILPAPETPYAGAVDAARLHAVLEHVRMNYDWVVIDLPVVFQRLSLMTISESDRAFLVSTSELPSLHLARKAVNLLDQLGFPKERFQMMVNRINRHDEIAGSDIEKLFNCSVHSRIPNDYFSLHRAVTLGQPVDGHCELGKAIEDLAGRLSGQGAQERKKTATSDSKAVLSPA